MDVPFDVASAVTPQEPGVFVAAIPDGWQQGRGAFGGLVLGVMVRAMLSHEPERDRVLRTLTSDIAAPVLPGPALVRVRELRRGKRQTNVLVTLEQGGASVALATGVLSAARGATTLEVSPPRPAGRPAADVPIVPLAPPLAPVFSSHFEYRPDGPLPFCGAPDAVTSGWVRPKAVPSRVDAALVTALLDAWWPALFTVVPGPLPMSTISFAAQLLVDPATLPPDEPLFHRARLLSQRDGFALELRELWHRGELVATNQQTFAVLR